MTVASLEKTASLDAMTGLVLPERKFLQSELERAGREPTTDPDYFDGRDGYVPDFLDGWSIDLPMPKSGLDDVVGPRRGGTGHELKYEHFSVVMSGARRMPMLTACNIDGKKSRSLPRITTWSFDGRLNKEDQWGDALYDGNELDRGHMVRREDPVWGSVKSAGLANEDTFHFTNSCPQMARVNQVIWLGLENYVLNHTRQDDMKVSVFTGPFFTKDDLEYRGARIPLAFWKVVAIVTEDGRPSATAYKIGQEEQLSELEFVFGKYKTFQISIQKVIDETGLRFDPLVKYDGFSEHERVSGGETKTLIDTLDKVRV